MEKIDKAFTVDFNPYINLSRSHVVGVDLGHSTEGDVNVTVKIRCPCNYSCDYCVSRNIREPLSCNSVPRLRAVYDQLDSFAVTFFDCGGSEPTLHPQVRELLELALEFGAAYFPTNNSVSPERWLPRKNLERLVVGAALHPEGEGKVDAFANNLLEIRDGGAHVVVIFVAHPARLSKIKDFDEYFSKLGVEMQPIPFHGYYSGKEYPLSYTEDERKIFEHSLCEGVFPHIWNWAYRLSSDMKIRDFSGIPCIAGFRTIYVDEKQQMRRCLYGLAPLERRHSRSMPCPVRFCGCGLQLDELNTYDDAFWGYWRQLGEGKSRRGDLRLEHEDLYRKNKAKYWAIMERYGKTKQLLADDVKQGKVNFPHVLYEKTNESLLEGLETYSYGNRDVHDILMSRSPGIFFNPSTKNDCLTTPYLDVLPSAKGAGRWLKITLSPAGGGSPGANCTVYLQDEQFSQISRNLLSGETNESNETGALVRYIALPEGLQRLRVVISVWDGSPTYIPNSLKIEQSACSSYANA